MRKWNMSTSLAAATLLVAAVFGGNTLAVRGQTPPPPPETTAATEAATESTTLAAQTEPTTEAPSEATEQTQVPTLAQTEAVSNRQVLVYDATAREMLQCTGDGTQLLYPASITKLFTAWVALEHLEPETVVKAGEELSLVQPGSSIAYIGKNCRLTVEMLVEAMLLPSGNDAAYVLAAAAGRAAAGDASLSGVQAVQAFVKEMNRQAQVLGLENSHFSNPDGYHAGAHYSCLRDVAVIAELALRQPVIAKYMACTADKVVFKSGEHITWYNSNRLVYPDSDYYRPGILGMKTGYTEAAGYCLLAAFQQGERQLVIGVFGAENGNARYDRALELLEDWR